MYIFPNHILSVAFSQWTQWFQYRISTRKLNHYEKLRIMFSGARQLLLRRVIIFMLTHKRHLLFQTSYKAPSVLEARAIGGLGHGWREARRIGFNVVQFHAVCTRIVAYGYALCSNAYSGPALFRHLLDEAVSRCDEQYHITDTCSRWGPEPIFYSRDVPLPLKQIPAKTKRPKGGVHPARTPIRQTDTGTTTTVYTKMRPPTGVNKYFCAWSNNSTHE